VILIDTSAMVDFLRNTPSAMTESVSELCESGVPLGISAYTYMELLSGARDDLEFATLEKNLGAYRIYYLPESLERYSGIARIYFDLRRKGITPRSMVDLMIVYTSIIHDLYLLHNDRDFGNIAPFIPGLKIWPPGTPYK